MDLTDAYANAAHIPQGDTYPARWAAAAATFRAAHPPRDIAFGAGDRQRLDLFLPPGQPRGLVVFLHGGYWLATGRRDWSHLSAGPLVRGWAVAIPSYDLCPVVRIGQIVRQSRAAVLCAAGLVAGPLVLTGHSAGGHLAARLACADIGLDPARVLPISPLSNLAPLMRTAMNATLRIDPAEAAAESPVLHPRSAAPVHVWVGAQERPAFLDQSRWLARAWAAPLTVESGRHHFDVIEGLEDPGSPLTTALLDGL